MQDSYTDTQLTEIEKVFEPLGIFELMESIYETNLSVEDVIEKLEATGLFSHNKEFQDYVDTH